MGLTANQRKAIADLQAICVPANQSRPKPQGGLGGRMADMVFEEIPMSMVLASQDRAVSAALGTMPTFVVLLARCKVTVKDQTGWPIEVKKAVPARGKWRPQGAEPEPPLEPVEEPPPAAKAVPPSGVSPLPKQLEGIMGNTKYQERIAAAEAAARKHPEIQDLPKDEAACVRGYTEGGAGEAPHAAAIEYNKTHPISDPKKIPKYDYQIINRTLREGDLGAFKKLGPYVDAAVRGLTRLKPTRKKSFRGIQRGSIPEDGLKPGRVFMDKGVGSSSTDLAVAESFVEEGPAIIFKIQAYSGRNVSALSKFPNETELTFLPGARFFIAGRRTVKTRRDGKEVTDLEITLFEIRKDLAEFTTLWGAQNVFIGYLKSLREEYEKAQQP